MPLPWVSRELYERVKDDLRKSEKERLDLLDRLLGQNGIAPLQQVLAELLPDPTSPAAEEIVDSTTGVISAGKLRQMAQDAANKRAGKI